jgi:hypothetical protein
MTLAGMPLEEDAATARLRKAETRARNELARTRNELLRVQAGERPTDKPTDRSEPVTATPAAKVEEKPVVKAKVSVAPVPVPTPPGQRPLNRRARKELARQARERAKREAQTARTR